MSIQMFRNATIYRLPRTFPDYPRGSLNAFSEILAAKPARLPGSQELATMGFVAPFGVEDRLAEVAHNAAYLMVEKAERLLPATAIRQAVEAKVREIENSEVRKVYAKEKGQIKDEIVLAKLPHTFIQKSRIGVLIDWPYIIVDTASQKKADQVLTLLRETLGSLPVRPVAVKASPSFSMTNWVRDSSTLREPLSTGESFKSSVPSPGNERLSGTLEDFEAEGMQALLNAGHQIDELRIVVDNAGIFHELTLTKDLVFKGISFDQVIRDQATNDAGEEPHHATLMDATLLLVVQELRFIVRELLDALGGEQLPNDLSGDALI